MDMLGGKPFRLEKSLLSYNGKKPHQSPACYCKFSGMGVTILAAELWINGELQ